MPPPLKLLSSSADFKKHYNLHEELGRGSYAVVFRCSDVHTEQEYAVKVIDKSKATPSQLNDLEQECELMFCLKHEHIVNIKELLQTQNTMFIIIELVRGGDLFKLISNFKHYSEAVASSLMLNVLSGVNYLHSQDVCHRDLKPDNLLMVHAPPAGSIDPTHPESRGYLTEIKIADFGFACKVERDAMIKCCGTPYFIAPEVLNAGLFKTAGPYGKKCDMWSLGIITYVILCGFPPFHAEKRNILFKTICKGDLVFPAGSIWDQVSDLAKDFVSKLIVVDPDVRLSPEQALTHPWIQQHNSNNHKDIRIQKELSEFNARYKLRGAVFGVEAINRMIYLSKCKDLRVKPNSNLLELLESQCDQESDTLDLSNNYVGKRGIESIMTIVKNKPGLKRLILSNNDVETSNFDCVVRATINHPNLTYIDLSHNPLSRHAAKQIINLAVTNKNIKFIELEGTLIHPTKVESIQNLLRTNRSSAANASAMAAFGPVDSGKNGFIKNTFSKITS